MPMRVLTQVWVFFVALIFLFLLLGFQLAGRAGLLIAFLISLIVVYAALQRGIRLFRKKLNAQEFSGNDSSGFLTDIHTNKLRFGLRKINVYRTEHNTPPLIWKNKPEVGHIILNFKLLDNLNPQEIKFLSLFLLAHLQNRSFLLTPILSVIQQSFFSFNIFSIFLSVIVTTLFKTKADVYKSDNKFKSIAEVSNYELGFFINKLHCFEFHQSKKQLGTEFFSVLSLNKNDVLNMHGIPNLNLRLEKIMGFTIQSN